MRCEADESKILIRKMNPDDVGRVRKIEEAVFSLPWSEKSFADACTNPNNVYLVCEYDGEIAGYCGMWTVMGEGNITNMAVSVDFRRRGIGESLMRALHEEGSRMGVDTFFLEVRESNASAISLYKKMGYTEAGKRKRFYEKPVEDAIVMCAMKPIAHD
jgi:ribosomal-protein-alanine N-acetyltransferase